MTSLENRNTRGRSEFDESPWNRFVGIGDRIVEGDLDGPPEGWPDMDWFQPVVADRMAEYAPSPVTMKEAGTRRKTDTAPARGDTGGPPTATSVPISLAALDLSWCDRQSLRAAKRLARSLAATTAGCEL